MIHPTAIIDPGAKLADNVEVGPYSVIGADVEIGEGTVIGPHVVIKGPTTIGKDNKILQFASVGEEPQDLKFDGEETRLEIGDRNTIREFCTLNRGTPGGGYVTKIGNDNLLMAYVHVAHDCILGDHIILSNNVTLAGHVIVEDKVKLGGFTVVHQFCRLGYSCFTGGNALIIQDIPPFTLAAADPSSAVGINKVGLQRAGYKEDAIKALHKAFRQIIFTRGNRAKAIESVADLVDAYPEVERFVKFIEASERGVVRSRR